jgi:cytochrome c553
MKTAFSVTLAVLLALPGAFAVAQPAKAPEAAKAADAPKATAPAAAAGAPAAAPAPAAAASGGAPAAAPAPAAAAAPAPAAPAPAKAGAKADTAAGGKIATQVCAACHNADGNSTIAVNPKLAGQHPEYLSRQLAAFKENKDRKNAVMLGFATALSADDMRNVSAYFAEQKPKDGTARNPAAAKLGEKIYRGGIAEKGIAACAGCHGPAGAGVPSQYPRLGGQFADYTKAQLAAFRSGERKNDPLGPMRGVAAKMSDKEIEAVADYIAGMKPAN